MRNLLGPGVNVQTKISMQHLSLSVSVDDDAVRNRAPGFDGFERAFALIPFEQGTQVNWVRRELAYGSSWSYSGSSLAGGAHLPTYDMHSVHLGLGEFDVAAAVKYGIAFGLDTNVGTKWLQTADDNYKPTP